MKSQLAILAVFFLSLSTFGQSISNRFYSFETRYFNENGNPVDYSAFQNRWKNEELNLGRWDSIGKDSIRHAKLFFPEQEALTISYAELYKNLEKLTNTSITGNPVIIIHYNFLNDLCSPNTSINYWNDLRVRREKRFSDNLQRKVEKQNTHVITLHFFEPGITFEPSQILKQFFHIDTSSYLKNALFKNSSFCGATAIINPGGKTLIHRGQVSINKMVDSLENWESLFEN